MAQIQLPDFLEDELRGAPLNLESPGANFPLMRVQRTEVMRTELAPERFHALTVLWDLFNKPLSKPGPLYSESTTQETRDEAYRLRVIGQSSADYRVYKIRNDEWLTQ